MAGPAVLRVDVVANASKAQAALKDTGDAATGLSSTAKKVGAAIAGAFVIDKVVDFGKASVKAFEDSQVATSRLENVFKSMGETTGEAAKQAEKYAGKLSLQIGVQDEAIMAGQAMLATFSDVSSQTARTAGIFDRATAAAADLAAAGFGDLQSNSVQLGKALQDPVKGITALARSGVNFSDAQKESIKQMVKSGDLLGAQRIVLENVEKQVKGTAAATVTNSAKMAVAYDETQEAVGKLEDGLMTKLAPALIAVLGFIQSNIGWIGPVVAGFTAWAAVVWLLTSATTAFDISLGISVGWIALIVVALAAFAAAIIWAYNNVSWFKSLVDTAGRAITTVFGAISDAAQAVFGWIARNWPTLLVILTGPFGLAVLLIANNFGTIRDAVVSIFSTVVDVFGKIAGVLGSAIGTLGHIAGQIGDAITKPFRDTFNGIASMWNKSVGALSFKVPGWVPGFGGEGFDVPDMPHLALGGSVLRTGLALVHRGETFSGVGRSLPGSAPTTVQINVTTTGLGADAPEIQRAVVNAFRAYAVRNGPIDLTRVA